MYTYIEKQYNFELYTPKYNIATQGNIGEPYCMMVGQFSWVFNPIILIISITKSVIVISAG